MRQRDDRERIEAEAAEWVIRLGGEPLSADEHAEFERWSKESPFHAKAFAFAERTWIDLAGLRRDPGSLADDFVPASRRHRRAETGNAIIPRGAGRSWLRAGILSVCLATAAGLATLWYGDPAIMLAADYRAGPGEQRTVSLPDGSTMELSSGSAAALHYSDQERRVELLKGAAYFTAAPMGTTESRPFVVEGANGTATALGTQFIVDRLPDAVDVTVAEHDVRVALAEARSDAGNVLVSPGQTVRYSPASGLGEVRERNIELATAWRRGRLVFDEVPLSEVVAELNRYRRGRIVITNQALANRRVSGAFETGDLDNALRTIARELSASAASVPPFVTLLY